jgi:hypothetical protein
MLCNSCSSRVLPEVHRFEGEVTAEKVLRLLAEGHTVVLQGAKVRGNLDFSKLEGVEPSPGFRLIAMAGQLIANDSHFTDSVIAGGQTLTVRFVQPVAFTGCTFHNYASFREAVFCEGARFERSEFLSRSNFQGAQFKGPAMFLQAVFGDEAQFQRTFFVHSALFTRAEFRTSLSFQSAIFLSNADFLATNVKGYADFTQLQAHGHFLLNTSTFADKVLFSNSLFHARFELNNCKFQKPVEAEQCVFTGPVSFNQAQFSQLFSLSGTRFAGGSPDVRGVVLPAAEPRANTTGCVVLSGTEFRFNP